MANCNDCGGSGKVQYLTVHVHADCDGKGCSGCRGRGSWTTTEKENCGSCGGTGKQKLN
jgi:DnaJ-class molecular chaperone